MEDGKVSKNVFDEQADGRGLGRPRLRWLDKVESDHRQLCVRRCGQRTHDREEWKTVDEEAEVLQGPWNERHGPYNIT